MDVSPVTGELYTFSFSYNFPGGNSADMIFRKFTRGTDGNYVAGTESIINTYLIGIQYAGHLTINSITGDYVLDWTSDGQDGSGYGAYMKVFDKYNAQLKAETRINQTAYGNQLASKAIWNEASNNLVIYYWYSAASSADIRYQIFDGNNSYAYVSTEVVSIVKNLVDEYAGQFILRYDQASRRIFLAYDEFSGSNTKGWYRQFIFTPAGCTAQAVETTRNYVQTKEVLQKRIRQEATVDGLSELSVRTTREYLDGLGRSVQQVTQKGSPSKKDFVQPIVYDQNGRQPKSYLAYAASSCDLSYKTSAVTDQAAFYNNSASSNADRVVNDTYPFKLNVFDNSPLDSIVKIYQEGSAWQTGTDHSVRKSFRMNTNNEVKKWIYDPSSYTADGSTYYVAGSLYVTQTTDEDGNRSWIYKDLLNRIVLSKEENTTNSEFLETYYIYDDLNQLRFVIPPKRSSATSINYNSTDADQNIFCYDYDARHRMIEKKIPGGGTTYYVYDKLDRLILEQQSNLRGSYQWLFTKYDALNRIIESGIYTHTSFLTRAAMQSLVNSNFTPLNESRQASTTHGYSNVAWPISSTDYLIINYYDNYDFDNNGTADYNYSIQSLIEEAVVSPYNAGLLTGNKTKILNTSDWLKNVFFYDKFKRPIQTQRNNHKNLTVLSDIITTVYDFSGKIILNKESYNPGSNPITITIKQAYDHADRPTIARHQVNSNPEVILSEQKYNELGQLVEKNLHSENNGSSYLQSLDYTYNIRGWQNNINNSSLSNDGVLNNDANDLFGIELFYENAGGIGNVASYSGNISGTIWKSSSTYAPNLKAYKYLYDGVGRILEGKYAEKPSAAWLFAGKLEERNITYDKNGNINTLLRTDASAATLDNLSYTYTGNQLTNLGTVTYTYDANGNMASDGANGYTYNHLNLLSTANINTTGLTYTYSASGQKLRWVRSVPAPIQPTADYIGPLVYKNDVLQQFATAEGRVELSSSIFSYVYDIRDHQGNLRLSFNKSSGGTAQIVQENHYYPFGSSQYSYTFSNASRFQYNNKELQDEAGLNGWYDYGARMYNSKIGRWNGVDPLAEKYYSFSPYNYVLNNPSLFIDPNGKSVEEPIEQSDLTNKTLDVVLNNNHQIEFEKSSSSSLANDFSDDDKPGKDNKKSQDAKSETSLDKVSNTISNIFSEGSADGSNANPDMPLTNRDGSLGKGGKVFLGTTVVVASVLTGGSVLSSGFIYNPYVQTASGAIITYLNKQANLGAAGLSNQLDKLPQRIDAVKEFFSISK